MAQIEDHSARIKNEFTAVSKRIWKCNTCAQIFKGSLSNCRDHLWSKHSEIAKNITGLNQSASSSSSSHSSSQNNGRNANEPSFSKRKISITIDPEEVIRNVVQFIIQSNLSLRSADLLGELLLNNILKPFGITINRHTIRKFIMEANNQIYKLIAMETKDKFPMIQFDSATRYNRAVMSTSLRYLHDQQIRERTIGIVTQTGSQTGQALAEQIIDLLSKIEMDVDDIYCSCTDMGRNMIKASDIIGEAQQQIEVFRGFLDEEEDEDLSTSIVNELLDEEENGQSSANASFEEPTLGHFVSKMFCGAHACQLAAKSVSSKFEKQIAEIRKVAIEAKKIRYRSLFQNIKIPRTDVVSRWDSSYMMIKDFVDYQDEYKTIGDAHKELKLSGTAWIFAIDYEKAFKPVFLAMKDFQKPNMTMSDFLIRWTRMLVQLNQIPGQKSTLLIRALSERFQTLLQCDAFAAALLLDPRFAWNEGHEIFNTQLKERGMKQLQKIFVKLKHKQIIQNSAIQQIQTQPAPQNSLCNAENETLTDIFLRGNSTESPVAIITADFIQIVNNFVYGEKIPTTDSFDIIDYWEKKKFHPNFKEIYPIASVVFGCGFSTVKVERDFSGFALIYHHLRTRLGADALNSIFVIKFNLDLLKHVKFIDREL